MKKLLKTLAVTTLVLAASSCANHVSKPKQTPKVVKFAHFSKVEVKEVSLAEAEKDSSSAQNAAKIMNNRLEDSMEKTFNNVKIVKDGEAFSKSGNVLRITPVIEGVKFESVAKRIWFGPMAGKSAILMKVTYSDENGKVIAEPEFYRVSGAWFGAVTYGYADQKMLNDILRDMAKYPSQNK